MKALILAAGYGTRLYPYTKNYPKPLLKVNNKPIIEYLLERLDLLEDISEIVVVTNERFYNKFNRWRQGHFSKGKIRILNDKTRTPDEKLGAIGDMNFAFDKIDCDDDYLILGGDNFFGNSLRDFIASAKKNSPSVTVGLFDIKDKKEASHYGVVSLDARNRILKFEEKPVSPKSSLIAMCLYYFSREKLKMIKEYLQEGSHYKDAIGVYINWLCRKDTVFGFVFEDLWVDIGHIHTYKKLKTMLEHVG